MRAARDRYMRECDVVGRFLEEHYAPAPGDPAADPPVAPGWVARQDVREEFVRWAAGAGAGFLGTDQLDERLQRPPWLARPERHRKKGYASPVRLWSGIRKLDGDELPAEEAAAAAVVADLVVDDEEAAAVRAEACGDYREAAE
jgi:hypothetical protein